MATPKKTKTAKVTAAEVAAPVVESDVIPADGLPAPVDNPVTFEPVIAAVPVTSPEPAPVSHADNVSGEILVLSLDAVFPDPDQPRKTFDRVSLVETGNNIRENGQLVPIRVSLNPDIPGQYLLEDGERRYQSCRIANIPTIRAIVVPKSTGAERLVKQMSANTGVPLLPMETANGYNRLTQSGWSEERIAKTFGVSKATVELDLMLCNCAEPIQRAVDRGFSKSVARRLSTITEQSRQMGAFQRAETCPNDKKKMAAIEAYLAKKTDGGIFGELKETTPGDIDNARRAWGSLKSGFCAFKKTPFANGQGIVLARAMKSQAHRIEMEATAREMIKAAQKILTDLTAYQAAVEQDKPMAKAA
jgi:ParB/RepB/Spo0J family partition protein